MSRKGQQSTTVSLLGGRKIRDALSIVARRRKTTMGQLVRAAIDEKYGDELAAALPAVEAEAALDEEVSPSAAP